MDIDLDSEDEFPPATRAAYEAAMAEALAGRTLEALQARTLDGIAVPALGTPRADREAVAGRRPAARWSLVQKVPPGSPSATNARILEELRGGADAVDLLFTQVVSRSSESPSPDDIVANLDRVFSGVHLDLVTVHCTDAHNPIVVTNSLRKVAESSAVTSDSIVVHAGFDPLIRATLLGGDFAAALAEADRTTRACLAPDQIEGAGSLLAARGEAWHALGASEAQQLAIALASGSRLLRMWFEAGGSTEGAASLARRIAFRLVADQNQFVTTAKFRAFRRLWALVLDAFGVPQVPAFVHAEASYRMMTRRDPSVNILRSTIAVFAAAVGGADAITTLPHTAALGRPDAAARRLSRNVQLVLMEESNLHRITDPAAGAGGQEDLADALAEAGWTEFQQIEREGGIAASLASGALRERIARMDARERALVATRKRPITGTSTYPLLSERDASVEPGAPMPPPMPGTHRLAEPWEALRDRSDAALARTGMRPTLFLATLGPVSAHSARAMWARNLLEAGGIAVAGGEPYRDPGAAVAAFEATGAPVACIAADDATYATMAADAVTALKNAGAARVLIVGRNREGEGSYDPGPADGFLHEGLDMIALIADLHDRLGAPTASAG